ncbi:MAG TPA: fibronectin type III domain-containing protein [Pyrinomonadaceae bacterium]
MRTVALTITPAATAPSNLTASTGSVNRIDLKWTDNSNNESGFRIERCQGATCTNYTLLVTVNPNTTTYRNSGLPAGTTYRYRVRANTSVGYSVYSNVANGRTK